MSVLDGDKSIECGPDLVLRRRHRGPAASQTQHRYQTDGHGKPAKLREIGGRAH
jgi:hypothetical protein